MTTHPGEYRAPFWLRAVNRAMRTRNMELIRTRGVEEPRVLQVVRSVDATLLVDVGANTGQYAQSMRNVGYDGRILSFEPLSDAHARLKALAAQDPLWEVADRCAIGESEDEVAFNVSGNSVSSSILPIAESHVSAAPSSSYQTTELVKVLPLDIALIAHVKPEDRLFLKIDTQGYEAHVLRGATQLLRSQVVGLQIEMSLIELYEGQERMFAILDRVDKLGFELSDLLSGFADPVSNRVLQVDGLFVRKT